MRTCAGYSTDAGTRRAFAWEIRGRVDVPLVGPQAAVYAELWHSLAGSTNQADDFDFLRGGEAGFLVQLTPTPLYARLAYRIDRARGAGPLYDDTAEQFVLAAGVRVP